MSEITMRDVAEAAGVSVATVSRVLSGNRPVRPEIATSVREASERLGYRTHYVARALRRQSTQTVGMVVPYIANPFFPGVVQAVERSLHAGGHALFLCDSQDDPEIEADRVRALVDRRVDGLLVIPCDAEASAEAVREAARRVPLVQLDRCVEGVEGDHVGVDDAAGIAVVLDHLWACGRRRLVFVGAHESISTAGERLAAYRRGAVRFHPDSQQDVLLDDFSIEWGRRAAQRLSARRQLPEAIVCANDLIALGVVQRLRAARLEVPRDVAVTGFDDIGFAALGDPPLTTVRQPVEAIGEESVRLLLGRLAGEEAAPQRVRLAPELVVRASTVAAVAQPLEAGP